MTKLEQLAERLTSLHYNAGIGFSHYQDEDVETLMLCLETPIWVSRVLLTPEQVEEIRDTVVGATANCSMRLSELGQE